MDTNPCVDTLPNVESKGVSTGATPYSQLGYKCFSLIFYEDSFRNPSIASFVDYISAYRPNFYAFIRHDKDVDNDGNLKKVHYHLIIRFNDRHTIGYVARIFHIAPIKQLISKCDNIYETLNYFIHKGQEQKYQYSCSEICSNDTLINNYFTTNYSRFGNLILMIRDIKQTNNGHLSFQDLCEICLENGYEKELQTYTYLLRNLCDK